MNNSVINTRTDQNDQFLILCKIVLFLEISGQISENNQIIVNA